VKPSALALSSFCFVALFCLANGLCSQLNSWSVLTSGKPQAMDFSGILTESRQRRGRFLIASNAVVLKFISNSRFVFLGDRTGVTLPAEYVGSSNERPEPHLKLGQRIQFVAVVTSPTDTRDGRGRVLAAKLSKSFSGPSGPMLLLIEVSKE